MRITVKVGTSTLAHATGRLNIQRMEALCKVLSDLKNAGHDGSFRLRRLQGLGECPDLFRTSWRAVSFIR